MFLEKDFPYQVHPGQYGASLRYLASLAGVKLHSQAHFSFPTVTESHLEPTSPYLQKNSWILAFAGMVAPFSIAVRYPMGEEEIHSIGEWLSR